MRRSPLLNLVLFLLTFASTLVVGAIHAGVDLLKEPQDILRGLPFSLTLLSILLVHEFAHYITSRHHGIDASLPYFIPVPPPLSLFGTLGAFIKMRSAITTKNALMDIGASGPIAGFLVSIVAVVIGLHYSEVHAMPRQTGEMIVLGDSLLFIALSKVVIGSIPDTYEVYLHPVAFAGWIGFFVTSLNLIPAGQLDGGHIAYAVLGERHGSFSKFMIGLLVLLGYFFQGWLVWALLLFFLGTKHPPILFPDMPLDPRRKAVGFIALVIFVLTFIPVPVSIK
ncbi:MAG: site-2 protease family protein [Nitrospirae bacterium]|nr:site-2 protease family protein [Nitrospirota bacterium]